MTIEHLHAVPHLTTALTGPLQQLEDTLLSHQGEAEQWLRTQWQDTRAPFYASVDLRNAGFKLAPVDTNLFPAGFNNLNPSFVPLCVQAVQSAMEHYGPKVRHMLVVPENHTRNLFYLESLAALQKILETGSVDSQFPSGSCTTKPRLPCTGPPRCIGMSSGVTPVLSMSICFRISCRCRSVGRVMISPIAPSLECSQMSVTVREKFGSARFGIAIRK